MGRTGRRSRYDLTDELSPIWAHLYVGRSTAGAPGLKALLLLVADDGARDVATSPETVDWLYHPYDGGGDVIAPDQRTRDELRARHFDWLSAYPSQL